MRLIRFEIREPLPGHLPAGWMAGVDPAEAVLRYQAIVLTTLTQFRHLADSRLRLSVRPADGDEAVRFWLLPALAGHWRSDNGVYRTDGWEIDFSDGHGGGFNVVAEANPLCPESGARLAHAALLGLGKTVGSVTGPGDAGGSYFHAALEAAPTLPERVLPALPVIRSAADWQAALERPIGTLLKRWLPPA